MDADDQKESIQRVKSTVCTHSTKVITHEWEEQDHGFASHSHLGAARFVQWSVGIRETSKSNTALESTVRDLQTVRHSGKDGRGVRKGGGMVSSKRKR